MLRGRLGGFAEIATLIEPEPEASISFATLGLTYNPGGLLVFDAGLAIGLDEEAPDLVLLFGFTQNLGRIRGTRAPTPRE
jgi:hypothetical protein